MKHNVKKIKWKISNSIFSLSQIPHLLASTTWEPREWISRLSITTLWSFIKLCHRRGEKKKYFILTLSLKKEIWYFLARKKIGLQIYWAVVHCVCYHDPEYLMHDVFTQKHSFLHLTKNHPQWSQAWFTARDNNIEFLIWKKVLSYAACHWPWRKTYKRNFVYFHHPKVL